MENAQIVITHSIAKSSISQQEYLSDIDTGTLALIHLKMLRKAMNKYFRGVSPTVHETIYLRKVMLELVCRFHKMQFHINN
jgi:hypothetical protein